MKTTVGFLRSCIRGLKNEINIELKNGEICIIPPTPVSYLERGNRKVDKSMVLELIRAGEKQVDIAKHFGVTRQAISFVKKELKKEGLL